MFSGYKKEDGQALIETVFVLILLLVLIFGIAEFSRAWYVKNSLNNSARIGARVAVVDPNLSFTQTVEVCSAPPVTEAGIAVCDAPGVRSGSTVTVEISIDNDASFTTSTGDTVTVKVETEFDTIIAGLLPWLDEKAITSVQSMRYEL